MKIEVKAATSFAHGSRSYNVGDQVEVTKGEADELEKAGLITLGEAPGEQEPEPAEKMADDVENKMADAPANKASTTTKKK